ncbi:MAG TPA: hypothetical protein VMX17_03640 [Candidatus Glassbacteria bacterium]|nr:hypothetical protein [Candidatus Glassbacteria bacterium]
MLLDKIIYMARAVWFMFDGYVQTMNTAEKVTVIVSIFFIYLVCQFFGYITGYDKTPTRG